MEDEGGEGEGGREGGNERRRGGQILFFILKEERGNAKKRMGREGGEEEDAAECWRLPPGRHGPRSPPRISQDSGDSERGGEEDSCREGLDIGHGSQCWLPFCHDARGAGALCEFDFEIEFKFKSMCVSS